MFLCMCGQSAQSQYSHTVMGKLLAMICLIQQSNIILKYTIVIHVNYSTYKLFLLFCLVIILDMQYNYRPQSRCQTTSNKI